MSENSIDYKLLDKCFSLAYKVSFITTRRELELYASSLYNAMIWGRKVNKKKK